MSAWAMWSEELFCSLCCLSPLHVGTALSQSGLAFACSTVLLLLTKGTYKNPGGESCCAHPSCRFSAPLSHLWGHWGGSMVEAVDSQSLLLLTLLLSDINLACSCVTEVYILKLECFKVWVLLSWKSDSGTNQICIRLLQAQLSLSWCVHTVHLGFWKLWVIRFRDHQPESVSNISCLQRRGNNREIN